MVLNATTLLVAGVTGQFERGDQSKPYRYVPMFDAEHRRRSSRPAPRSTAVNECRSNIRPLEQLPTARDRYALGLRLNHRFTSTTLRIDERIYYDSWQLKATTTDARYIIDAGKHLRIWPHVRLNAQSGANFYQLAYSANANPQTEQVSLPLYRTDDRELSPLITLHRRRRGADCARRARDQDAVGAELLRRRHVHEVFRHALHHLPDRPLRRDRHRRGVRVMRDARAAWRTEDRTCSRLPAGSRLARGGDRDRDRCPVVLGPGARPGGPGARSREPGHPAGAVPPRRTAVHGVPWSRGAGVRRSSRWQGRSSTPPTP